MAVILFVLFLAGLHTLLASEQCVVGGPHCKAALSNESEAEDLAPAVLLLQSGLRREEVGDVRRSRRRRRRYDLQFGGNCALTVLGSHSYFGGGLHRALGDACTEVTESVTSAHVLVKAGCRVAMHGERGCRGEERELVSAVGNNIARVLVFSHLSDIGWGGGRLSSLSCTCVAHASQLNVREDGDDHDDEEDHEDDEAEEAQGEDQGAEDEDGPAADEEVEGREGDSAPADGAGSEDFAEEHEAEGGDESSPGEEAGPETRTGLVRLEGRGRRRRFRGSWLIRCTWNFYRDVNFHGTSWPAGAGVNLCANQPHSVRSALKLPGRRQSSGYGLVAPGCRLELFDEKDCRGERVAFVPGSPGRLAGRFHSHFGSLRDGDGWNDRVLSVMCRCS